MLNLCILEDNLIDARLLESHVLDWGIKKSISINIEIITSFEDFLSFEKNFGSYHGFLLDIELPDGNGMMAANKVRDLGYKTPIAFITSNDSFVFDGYDVFAMKYLLKPISQEPIDSLMDKLYGIIPDTFYSFENNTISYSIKYKDIIYFESQGHYVDIFTINSSYKQRKNISCLTKELTDDFCQSYRTMIINMRYVKTIQNSFVILRDGKSLPLGKKFANDFKKAYFRFHLKN